MSVVAYLQTAVCLYGKKKELPSAWYFLLYYARYRTGMRGEDRPYTRERNVRNMVSTSSLNRGITDTDKDGGVLVE